MENIEGLYKLEGAEKGKTVVVVAGVHGDEVSGIRALHQAVRSVYIQKGVVYFLIGNPRAVQKGTRSIERNLNRMFRSDDLLSQKEKESYEYYRSRELMPIFDTGDALLDLHSSSSLKSTPFIICEPHSYEVASFLSVGLVSSGWDNLEPGGTDYYMNLQKKIGICLECGSHGDARGQNLAFQSILSFLERLGLGPEPVPDVTLPRPPYSQRKVHMSHIHLTSHNFFPQKEFADFEQVRREEVLGTDGGREITAPYNGLIVFCRTRQSPKEEAFLLGKEV